MKIHAEILKKSGVPEFAVIPYNEFLQIQEKMEDYEDLVDLRKAKKQTGKVVPLTEAKKILGL